MKSKTATLGFVALLLASTGAAFSGEEKVAVPSLEANKAIVRSLFKALNDGDLATRNRLVDPRRTFHSATENRQETGETARTLAEA